VAARAGKPKPRGFWFPMEKKRVSAKRRMMHAALNEDFLYQALFSE
jgi:hypothetical protein